MGEQVPSVYEWAGGAEAFERLTEVFYRKVLKDDLLEPLFRRMTPEHPHDVAVMLSEVFGGPRKYTDEHGGFKRLVGKHRNRDIQPEQRNRWVQLILESADEVGFPEDAEFRSAFVSYIEFGSRRAMANSKPGAVPKEREMLKRWGWGEATPGEE
ncbi:group II truncated hemoglobin [Saccharothrix algeriensis]|uniref:Hemoglobin n=1 Tax=Saccharothrix algeriensis TaxID=173560 RepID=A0ABS2SGQ6_9PSEU|nr:group II truncated hemoglobin [Saccharothrix algeriensis]MBM7815130.1 hemoglobin [Saccharothrix algeriensis]